MKAPALLTTLLITVTLASAAPADVVVPPYVKAAVGNARYQEWITDTRGSSTRGNLAKGADDQAAEQIQHTQVDGSGLSSAFGTALSSEKGPTASAFVSAVSTPSGDPSNVGYTFDTASVAENRFDVAIYPKGEGPPPYPRVLIGIAGDYSVTSRGRTSLANVTAGAGVDISVYDYRGEPLVGDGVNLYCLGDCFSQKGGRLGLSFWVPLRSPASGQYYNTISVIQSALARAHTAVLENSTIWSESYAWIDPQVYIDPSFEYADDFVLYFSPNMEPLPGPLLHPVGLAESDFESQSLSPFSTDYYEGFDTPPAPGQYEIGDDPASFGPADWGGVDHTAGTGSFMIVDGSENADDRVVYIETEVVAGARYELSGAVQNILDGSLVTNSPELSFRVNGVELDTYTPLGYQAWNTFRFYYDAPTPGPVTFAIHDNNTESGGNDFGLDDLALSTTVPEPSGPWLLSTTIMLLLVARRSKEINPRSGRYSRR